MEIGYKRIPETTERLRDRTVSPVPSNQRQLLSHLSRAVRILAVDDDPLFLGMISDQLEEQESCFEITTFTSPRKAIDQLEVIAPDIALIDVVMPQMDGFACAECIRRKLPKTVILLVTGAMGVLSAHPAIKSGSYGVLKKPFTSDQLRAAITSAMSGFFILGQDNARVTPDARAAFIIDKGLTDREVQALDALSKPLGYKQIADQCGWSDPVTAKIIRKALAKLGVHTRSQASALWHDFGKK